MQTQKIESQDVTIADLFSAFHVVPDYQREYVWEVAQVEQLFADIYDAFSDGQGAEDSEYFIGSIVCCPGRDGLVELIDGQQRMTTAYLFLCALRDHLAEIEVNPITPLAGLIEDIAIDALGNETKRCRLDLQYEDSEQVLQEIASGEVPSAEGRTRSIENILGAYSAIRTFLKVHFGDNEATLRHFYAFFTQRVKLIRIQTQSVARALKIFETINDRGKGLDAMDLLKNLMFMNAKAKQFDTLKRDWKKLVDALYGAKEKPLRFLRYFIFAQFDVDRLKEDEIYDWFLKNKGRCGYETDPIAFVRELLMAVDCYVNFLSGRDAQGVPNRYLENMSYLSGAARQHLILLLAARELPSTEFSTLCKEVENLFFAHIITRENTREFERRFAQWAPELREVADAEALRRFVDERFAPSKRALAQRFELAFDGLREESIQKYRMRYVLGKLAQHVNEAAYGGEGTENTQLKTFVNKKVHVEHVFPQTPTEEAVAEFDRQEDVKEWIPMLGNLTLAEEAINTSLGNKVYSTKRPVYGKSKFLLTAVLAGDHKVGSATAIDRAVEPFQAYETWTSMTIRSRQSELGRLAQKVWDMPAESGEGA